MPLPESHGFIFHKVNRLGYVISEVLSVSEFLLFKDQIYVAFFHILTISACQFVDVEAICRLD